MITREPYAAGDIVVVSFPYTDQRSTKVRPALVLSRAEFNGRSEDVILAAITSQLMNTQHSVLIEKSDMIKGTLPKASRVKVANVATLEQRIVRHRIGRVSPETLERVMRELRAILA